MYQNFTQLIEKKEAFEDILGQTLTKGQLLSALISNRSIIIVGPPGIGKTTLAKNVAKYLPQLELNDCDYNCDPKNPICPRCRANKSKKTSVKGEKRFIRIQGSPDLTVEDLLGDIDPIKALEFGPLSLEAFTPGKIFKANNGVLFFDEVNRCPEKLQNALLEILEEKKATIGSYEIEFPANFIFIGSLHPEEEILIEQYGILKMVKIGMLVDSLMKLYEPNNINGSEVINNFENLKAFSYNPKSKKIESLPITSFIRHKPTDYIFEIVLQKGRKTKITGKHSVFKEQNGNLIPSEVSNLKVGDKIVIPQKIEHKPIKIQKIDLIYLFKSLNLEKEIFIKEGNIREFIIECKQELLISNNNRNITKYKFYERMPLSKVDENINSKLKNVYLGINGSSNSIKKELIIDNDLCWLIGFFIAEGFTQKAINNKGTYRYNIYVSNKDIDLTLKTQKIILEKFGVQTRIVKDKRTDVYNLTVSSFCLYHVFKGLFLIGNDTKYKRIPQFIYQLNKEKIKYFLKGYIDGDGNYYTDKNGYNKITMGTTSEMLANDLSYLFMLFGKTLSISRIKDKRANHNDMFSMYLCNTPKKDILELEDENLVFRSERIKSIEKLKDSPTHVYDLEVLNEPKTDNFIGGFGGILLHNTMNPEDFSGTEKLSEVFIDRFDLIYMDYPESLDIEKKIVKTKSKNLSDITFPEDLLDLTLEFIRELRKHKDIERYPSVRVSLGLYERAKANALISKRKKVEISDIQQAVISVVSHRIRLKPSAKYLISTIDFVKKNLKDYLDSKEQRADFL